MLDTLVTLPLMVLELIVAGHVFCNTMPKRKLFWVRVVGSFIIMLEVIFLILFIYFKITDKLFSYAGSVGGFQESIFKFLLYVAMFFMMVGCMAVCYKAKPLMILFNCSGAYATQHLAKNIANLFPFFVKNALPIYTYIIEAVVCVIVYLIIYLWFVKGKVMPENQQGIKKKVLLSVAVIIVCIGVSRICIDDVTRGNIAIIAETIYAIISCLFILNISSGLTREDIAYNEIAVTNQLLHRASEQYRLSKENIELINIKCHDLKHQIIALKQNSSAQSIEKIEEAVMIYGSIAKTKNDALDIILTEKNLYCQKNGICLTCMVNGEDLSFMEETDIYSLFGNALSNAIESVSGIEDKTKRSISVNVKTVGNILTIHIENYFKGEVVFDGKYPKTFKDKDYHGYGMRSMDCIAKKYNGCMSVVTMQDKFILDFAFTKTGEND